MDRNHTRNGTNKTGKESLTKEQMEQLETAFLKLVTNEIEKDGSNWKDLYEVLKEACKADEGEHKKNGNEDGVNYQRHSQKGYSSPQETSSGFKINAERTKQQYIANQSTDSSYFQKEQNTSKRPFDVTKTKFSQPDELKRRNKYDPHPKNPNKTSSCNKENCYTGDNGRQHYNVKTNDSNIQSSGCGRSSGDSSNRNKTKNGKMRKSSKNSKDSKNKVMKNENVTNGTCQGNSDVTENYDISNENDVQLTTNDPLVLLDKLEFLRDGLQTFWRVTKEIVFFLLCLIILVVYMVLKFAWHVIWFVLKIVFVIIITIFCRIYVFLLTFNERYTVLQRIGHYISTGIELVHLFTGINIKSIFRRNKPAHVDQDDGQPVSLPTTSHDAVQHLLRQKESRPYRALCVSSNATDEEIKTNYRKMARLVHPDKCEDAQADNAFKALDAAFKKISDPQKREETAAEEEKERQWEEFNKNYTSHSEDFKKMFEDILNSIPCTSCNGKHKRTLIKDRGFLEARYCGDCNKMHAANDGDIWAENNIFGFRWTCYVCLNSEVYELTEWAKCQNLKDTIPVNAHKVPCRLGTQRQNKSRRRAKEPENFETGNSKKKSRKKGRRR